MNSVAGADGLIQLFSDEANTSLLLDTGFRKPLCLLTMSNQKIISSTMRLYFTLINVKAETAQIMDGLKTLGVLQLVKRFPDIMKPVLVKQSIKLHKGEVTYIQVYCERSVKQSMHVVMTGCLMYCCSICTCV